MISQAMQDKLLEQVRVEWESEFAYLTIMAWCYNNDFDGFGAWFHQQANEEREHGLRILRFINNAGGSIGIPSINVIAPDFRNLQHLFELTLQHEEQVTGSINRLVDQAMADNDHTTHTFLQWFIQEQVEEESTARHILAKIRRAEGAPGALFMIEQQLAGASPRPAAEADA